MVHGCKNSAAELNKAKQLTCLLAVSSTQPRLIDSQFAFHVLICDDSIVPAVPSDISGTVSSIVLMQLTLPAVNPAGSFLSGSSTTC